MDGECWCGSLDDKALHSVACDSMCLCHHKSDIPVESLLLLSHTPVVLKSIFQDKAQVGIFLLWSLFSLAVG